mgnify:CR=1 FL=1
MTALEIFFAVIGAIVIGVIFYYVFRISGPWGTFWSFLLVLILATIAVTAWITPFGPVFRDIAWLPILLVVILFALLLAAATPPGGRRVPPRTERDLETPEPTGAVAALGVFFFVLIIVLVAVALVGILV